MAYDDYMRYQRGEYMKYPASSTAAKRVPTSGYSRSREITRSGAAIKRDADVRTPVITQPVAEATPVATPIDLSNPIYANGSQPYMGIYDQLRKSLQLQRDADIKTMASTRDEDITKTNAGYDNTARQNYINYMQAQKRLPNELNALGIRGGASESSLIRLGTNYGSNVAANESARLGALNDIRSAYAKQVADYNKGLNERLAEAEATARENQINYEREQQQKDLEYFSGAIEGLYNDPKRYWDLIAQLQASNDPNKEYKVMLAMRAKNQLDAELQKKAEEAAKQAAASSGGGGGGGSSKKKTKKKNKSSGGNNNNNNSEKKKAAVAAVNAAQTKGQSMTEYYKKQANKNKRIGNGGR